MSYDFVPFSPRLTPEIDALLSAYKRVYPKSMVTPGSASAYLTSPWLAGGQNVICAMDDGGKMCGYAAVYNPVSNNYRPDTYWAIARLLPGLASPIALQDSLFDKVLKRVSELSRGLPGRKRRLAFQYHASENPIIDYVLSRGAVYAESVLRIRRDLSLGIPDVPAQEGIETRCSRMEDETEQRWYVELYNETLIQGRNQMILPAAISLADWQKALKGYILPYGTVILACDAGNIIGSVTVCWDEEENQRIAYKVGTVDNVFVRDGWRRRGIASRMICKGFEYLKENGLEFARLDVNSANQPGLKLYEGLGFVTMYESQMFVLDL